ncbi:hypothetical protein [Rhizobium hainanense]|uniref:Uncharacterized protein n=1 Tax=Rhizobium hainanense TaxID=52131 RepID=A0A1C3WKM1_9HYPH|nr:hypothetical protein [Rhizobium hainanense]SCB40510.1 hypothetical protein GA0061100_12523 [Rhizobium hainanense]
MTIPTGLVVKIVGVAAASALVVVLVRANIFISEQQARQAAAEKAAKHVMDYDPGKLSFTDDKPAPSKVSPGAAAPTANTSGEVK